MAYHGSTAWSVIVVVPARDEEAHLGGCLASLVTATSQVTDDARVHVVVAADSCTDDTETVAAGALTTQHASIVRVHAGNVGVTRAAAVAAASAIVRPDTPDRTWIAMTDADSCVPPEWLRVQLDAAQAGWRAVVGAIAVDDWELRDRALDAELRHHRQEQRRVGTRPVHGANLGVSATALHAIGGVPEQPVSEDELLVRRLEDTGLPVLWKDDLVVRTSARRSSRASGGFSSLLDDLGRRPMATASPVRPF